MFTRPERCPAGVGAAVFHALPYRSSAVVELLPAIAGGAAFWAVNIGLATRSSTRVSRPMSSPPRTLPLRRSPGNSSDYGGAPEGSAWKTAAPTPAAIAKVAALKSALCGRERRRIAWTAAANTPGVPRSDAECEAGGEERHARDADRPLAVDVHGEEHQRRSEQEEGREVERVGPRGVLGAVPGEDDEGGSQRRDGADQGAGRARLRCCAGVRAVRHAST